MEKLTTSVESSCQCQSDLEEKSCLSVEMSKKTFVRGDDLFFKLKIGDKM